MLGFIVFIVIYASILFHVAAEKGIWPRYLYKEPESPPIEELSTLVAALQFENAITFMETLGHETCKRVFHCPLAGLIMLGDSQGTLKFISHSGDQVISVHAASICSGNPLCAITAARVVHFRGSRENEALVIAYFSGKGMHAMLLNYETRSHGAWYNMVSASSNACIHDVVDIQVITGKINKKSPWKQIDYVAILDAGGNVFVGKDLALDWIDQPDAMVEPPKKWEMDLLGTDILRMHADEKSGVVLVNNQKSILLVDRKLMGIKSLCHDVFTHESTKIKDASFDSSESGLYVTFLLESGALIRLKISKNECTRMQRIYTLVCLDQNSCIPRLSSSGGYTMMTHNECAGKNSLTLYNHSEILSRLQKDHPWNPLHYVASSSTEEAMLHFLVTRTQDRLLDKELAKASKNHFLAEPQGASNCLQAKLQMWNHKNLLGKQSLAFLLPNAKTIVLFRPLFSPNKVHGDSKASGMQHIIVGILKSVSLIVAAIAGLRWAGAKNSETVTGPPTIQQRLFDMRHYTRKGMNIAESYGRYRGDNHYIRQRLPRIAKENLNGPQINVDRAPQYPQSSIHDEYSTDEDSSLELEEETL